MWKWIKSTNGTQKYVKGKKWARWSTEVKANLLEIFLQAQNSNHALQQISKAHKKGGRQSKVA
jgi:hypothetical protein